MKIGRKNKKDEHIKNGSTVITEQITLPEDNDAQLLIFPEVLYEKARNNSDFMLNLEMNSAISLVVYASKYFSTILSPYGMDFAKYKNYVLRFYYIDKKSKSDLYELTNCSIKEILNLNDEEDVYNRMKNLSIYIRDYVNDALNIVHDSNINEELKNKIYYELLSNAKDKINIEKTLSLIPQFLNDNNYLLLFKSESLKDLKTSVLAYKNKKIISDYIYYSKDKKLLFDLFNNIDEYLDYCYAMFDNDHFLEIKKWVYNEIKFKYVDDNIEKILNSSNEKVELEYLKK